MNHTATTNLAMSTVVGMILAVLVLIVIIPGYLHGIKAEAKTHSKSMSMSTSCNGDTDEPCQTTVCEDNKPCRTLVDSNSPSSLQQTKNTTTAAQQPQQQPNSNNDTTPFYNHPLSHKYRNDTFPQIFPTPQIPDYSDDDEFD
jgi:FtsZ-interacting cell division protein ZipA